jgi:hypothetical protein
MLVSNLEPIPVKFFVDFRDSFEPLFDSIDVGYIEKILSPSSAVEKRLKRIPKINEKFYWDRFFSIFQDANAAKSIGIHFLRKARGLLCKQQNFL